MTYRVRRRQCGCIRSISTVGSHIVYVKVGILTLTYTLTLASA
mgnify:CR=1 FL=1